LKATGNRQKAIGNREKGIEGIVGMSYYGIRDIVAFVVDGRGSRV
jgi:hypothetical protein